MIIIFLTASLLLQLLSLATSNEYVFYIYGDPSCPHCRAMKKFFTDEYGSSHVYFCNAASNTTCQERFIDLSIKIGSRGWVPTILVVEDCKTKAIVIGEVRDKGFWDKLLAAPITNNITVYMGESPIENITVNNTAFTMTYAPVYCRPHGAISTEVNVTWRRKPGLLSILPQLLILALLDSVNPCTLTIYVLFLATLLPRRNILLPGALFILLIYIGYLLIGLGLVWLAYLIPRWIFVLAAGLFALYNLYKSGKYGGLKGCKECRYPWIMRYMDKPFMGALILGAFSDTVLLPCSSGPLLLFTAMITEMDPLMRLLSLGLYVLVFITPILIIYFSMRSMGRSRRVIDWVDRNAGLLGFLSSILLLFIVFLTALSL